MSATESKKRQVTSWVKMFRKSASQVIVSNYSYSCLFSGNLITKTLIVFPDEIETMGIITIDKPLDKVEIPDIIKLYKKIKDDLWTRVWRQMMNEC